MQAVLSAAAPVFAVILIGFLCARFGALGAAATDSLNLFVAWVALPALLFQTTATVEWAEFVNLPFIAAMAGGIAATLLLTLALEWAGGAGAARAAIRGITAAYPNTGYMGIPLCLALFGPGALPAAIIATILTVCILFAIGVAFAEMEMKRTASGWATARHILLPLLRNPFLVAPAAGLTLSASGLGLPAPIERTAALLGAAASPCALMTIGLFLAHAQPRGEQAPLARLVVLKLLVQPGITALLALALLHMPERWSYPALLLSALPVGTGPFMLAKLYDRDAGLTSRAILVSTVGSVLTVSLLIAWISR